MQAVRLTHLSPAREVLSADSGSAALLASANVISKYTYAITHVKGAAPCGSASDL